MEWLSASQDIKIRIIQEKTCSPSLNEIELRMQNNISSRDLWEPVTMAESNVKI